MTPLIELKPGVYRKADQIRVLISTIGRRCVYTFASIDVEATISGEDTRPIPATTCSLRTFAKAVGTTPVRQFSPAEQKVLVAKAVSRVPYRKCNWFERVVFFPSKAFGNTQPHVRRRVQVILALIRREIAQTKQNSKEAAGHNAAVVSTGGKSMLARCFSWRRRVSCRFVPKRVSPAAS